MKLTTISETVFDTIKNYFKKQPKKSDPQEIIKNSDRWFRYYFYNKEELNADLKKNIKEFPPEKQIALVSFSKEPYDILYMAMAYGDNPTLRHALLKMPLSKEVAEVLVDYSILIMNKRWQAIEDVIIDYEDVTKKYITHFRDEYPDMKRTLEANMIRKQKKTKDPKSRMSDADDAKITTINKQRAETQIRKPYKED